MADVSVKPVKKKIPAPATNRMVALAWLTTATLPLIGLISLLTYSHLDPGWTNPQVHFLLFLTVGGVAAGLALAASEAARRRGDARVLLISLAFLTTGGFLALHALGTKSIMFSEEYAGFKVAIPVGLLIASCFALAASFVDIRPQFAAIVVRRRRQLMAAIFISIAVWALWTLTKFPPLNRPTSEGGTGSLLSILAGLGVLIYGTAAIRFWYVFRNRMSLLPASLIACFVLLTEAMIGVAVTGERAWHASWWLWHILIVIAYLLIGFAAQRQWRDERFRPLYLETTREHPSKVSVLFSDLAGFTPFTERSSEHEVARMLNAFHGMATSLVWRRFGGVVESLTGDGMYVSFNARGDQPDHALRAAGAALALQQEMDGLVAEHPDWPRMRIGVNTGDVVIREMGGDGFCTYQLVGDTVNTASRLEGQADIGGVLIGAETYKHLPAGAKAKARHGLHVKGKNTKVDAYSLYSLSAEA